MVWVAAAVPLVVALRADEVVVLRVDEVAPPQPDQSELMAVANHI